MFKIKLPQENVELECSKGANLYSVLASRGLIDAPCGGKGVCAKCAVTIDGKTVLSCEETVLENLIVCLPERNKVSPIISSGYMKRFEPELKNKGEFGLAIDIGTTTVVVSLIDLSTGLEVQSLSCLNAQKSYGQDVISRIQYCTENEEGTLKLQKLIVEDLNLLISQLVLQNRLKHSQIIEISIAGNTTMIHLLAGINPESMGSAPYVPAFYGPLKLRADDLGLSLDADCPVYCLSAIASFVGGDITAGMLACGIGQDDENVLFIDIGTNGEMLLSVKGELYCCSCAAGPALEGMNISCGIRAAAGAIEEVEIKSGKVKYKTIDDKTANGICGSGLLCAIAQGVKHDIIGPSGRFTKHPLVTKIQGKASLILSEEHEIYISQKDIRQVQLAKGAILSGILTLIESAGVEVKDLDKVIVAGQFGAHLEVESLVGSGLIPNELKDKITYAGNTSKSGSVVCLLSKKERFMSEQLAENIKYIEMSTLDGFEKVFVDCLNFKKEE
ncbi:MAG: ASKHA domain-containing protein [Proteocatella sp.]